MVLFRQHHSDRINGISETRFIRLFSTLLARICTIVPKLRAAMVHFAKIVFWISHDSLEMEMFIFFDFFLHMYLARYLHEFARVCPNSARQWFICKNRFLHFTRFTRNGNTYSYFLIFFALIFSTLFARPSRNFARQFIELFLTISP